jgi:hypothetical protein
MLDAKISRMEDVCGGRADLDFSQALGQVIENLNDQKCDAKSVRKIMMTVSFYPDPQNNVVSMELETTVKLAKKGARRALAFIGKGNDGQMGLFTEDPAQIKMFNQLMPGATVSAEGREK